MLIYDNNFKTIIIKLYCFFVTNAKILKLCTLIYLYDLFIKKIKQKKRLYAILNISLKNKFLKKNILKEKCLINNKNNF